MMKKLLLVLLGGVGLIQYVSAQVDQYQFELSIDNMSVQQITQSLGSGNDFFRDVVTDQSGNRYVLAHYDVPTPAPLGFSGYLLKFSSTGQLIYKTLIGTGITLYDIEIDESGSLYIGGGRWDRPMGSGARLFGTLLTGYIPSRHPAYQCSFILKINGNGDLIRSDTPTCGATFSSNYMYLSNIKVGTSGIYVGGTSRYNVSFGSSSYSSDLGNFFGKYSLTGVKIWARAATGFGASFGDTSITKNNFMTLDSNDNIYFTQRPSVTTLYINGITLALGGGGDAGIFSFDRDGNLRRYKYFNFTSLQSLSSVRVTKNNDLVIYGGNSSATGVMNFSGGLIGQGNFIVKLKNDGTYINHIMLTGGQYGSTALFSNLMNTDTKGNIYLMTSRAAGSFTFPNGQTYTSSDSLNYFIIKLDENFTTKYVLPLTGSLISNSFNHDLYIDGSGYVTLGTSFRGFTNFLGSNLTSDASISGNHYDMFVVKIGIESCYGFSSFGFKNEVVGGFDTTTMCWQKNGFNTLKNANNIDVNIETISTDQTYTVSIPFKNLTSIGLAQPKINFLGNWDVIAAAKGTGTLDIKIKVFNSENIKNLLR